MIDILDGFGEAATLNAAAQLSAVRDRVDAGLLQAAAHFADLHAIVDGAAGGLDGVLPGMEKTRVYGGAGCPAIGDFAPIDLGAALGITSSAASSLLGDALSLRHRLPRVWARVLAGEVQAWRARKIAQASVTLSVEAAALVDARVARIAHSVTSHRLNLIVKAAVMDADPDAARAAADAAAKERGVWVGQSDEHGTKTMVIKAASGDVIRLDAAVDHLADVLAELGDTDSKEQRRAKAAGLLADPQVALDLWHILDDTDGGDPDIEADPETDPDTEPDRDSETNPDTDRDVDPDTDLDAGPGPDSESGPGSESGAGSETESGADLDTDEELDADADAHIDLDADADAEGEAEAEAGDPAGSGSADATTDAAPDAVVAAGAGAGAGWQNRADRRASKRRRRRDRHALHVHISAETLRTGEGVVRVEGIGPMLASQLGELFGHDRFVVKPVIDLADRVSVDSYEIPDRIRERVRLKHLTCRFPWCNAPATMSMDLDHVVPFDDTGPPGQTSTETLVPLCRWHHRVKTHGRWRYRRLDDGAFEWTGPHGAMFRVDHTGTRTDGADRADSGVGTDHGDRSAHADHIAPGVHTVAGDQADGATPADQGDDPAA